MAGEFDLPSIETGDGLRVSTFPATHPAARHQVIICIPGYGATGESFARLAPMASRWNLQLLTPPQDAPRDPIAHYGALVARFARRFERPVLLGTSFGGPVALRAAAELGGAVSRLVLISTFARLHHPLRRLLPILGFLEAAAELVRPVGVHLLCGKWVERSVVRELLRETSSIGREEKHLRLIAALTCNLEEIAARIEVPALVIHGTRDLIVPISAGRALAAVLPRAELQEMRGAGHVPYVTHAREVMDMLSKFIPRASAGSSERPR